MSRAWMPLYVGDYLRDTAHLTTVQHGAYMLLIMHYWQHAKLPTDDKQLAAICRMSVGQWRGMREPIAALFRGDWTHKRIQEEIDKADRKWIQRAQAGQRGGQRSGIVRAIAAANNRSDRFVPASPEAKQNRTESEAKSKPPRTNHKEDITTTFSVAAREEAKATSVPIGETEGCPMKKPAEVSRSDLDAMIERKRASVK